MHPPHPLVYLINMHYLKCYISPPILHLTAHGNKKKMGTHKISTECMYRVYNNHNIPIKSFLPRICVLNTPSSPRSFSATPLSLHFFQYPPFLPPIVHYVDVLFLKNKTKQRFNCRNGAKVEVDATLKNVAFAN